MIAASISSEKKVFYEKMDKLLDVPEGSVQGPEMLKALENWDSLAILKFMVMADMDYRSNLQPSDITACQTVDDLAQLIISSSGKAV